VAQASACRVGAHADAWIAFFRSVDGQQFPTRSADLERLLALKRANLATRPLRRYSCV